MTGKDRGRDLLDIAIERAAKETAGEVRALMDSVNRARGDAGAALSIPPYFAAVLMLEAALWHQRDDSPIVPDERFADWFLKEMTRHAVNVAATSVAAHQAGLTEKKGDKPQEGG